MKGKLLIYQVFPRWFGNTTNVNKENGTIEENGVGKFSSFTTKALSEIRKMGFSHIWYTGVIEHATKTDYSGFGIKKDHPDVVKGNAGSPYAIKDYYDVDPDLADSVEFRMEEFEDLVERSHKQDLKVIVDFVANHVARQYFSDAKRRKVDNLGEKDDTSRAFAPDNNFYYTPNQELYLDFAADKGENAYHEFPAKATGNDRFDNTPNFYDWYETVKLNYGVDYANGRNKYFIPEPDTWYKMKDILLFWASKGVDGFRCDMAEMVPVEFWNWVIPKIKSKYKSITFIAEVYNPNEYASYIQAGFDYLYDKVGLYDSLKNIITGNRPSSDITGCWQSLGDLQPHMLNFLENHDEQRIASDFFAKDPFKAIPGLIVSATMNTCPFMVYSGQELGEKGMDKEGFSGIDGRTTIFDYWSVDSIRNWYNDGKFGLSNLTEDQKNLRKIYTKILSLCSSEQAISDGKFFDVMYVNYDNPDFDPTKQYAFFRGYKKDLLLIVANFDDKAVNININIPEAVYDYLNIDASKFRSAKDLLSNKKQSLKSGLSSSFETKLEAYSGRIFKFVVE
ncbi:alpha-amylase family glycosyl hydrolase [Dysgonomonas sp. 520]|uniref:alpha-amylase family glycosyl hydrolase n=1 Tax=Dysgonomonas sp. 520 TaxID=2302931 RepID=UPI0013D4F918|nr:alpha-amylase family glycosyl hydrolase [Dysgonomonas sp. 520]NDW10251.1 alpha-amylase [Dysgonomonas sp. 520]